MTAAENKELAKYIDHTSLKPVVTANEIDTLCREAITFGCFSVCVNGTWVDRAREQLKGASTKVCAVIGFPLGASTTEAKVAEALSCLKRGALELDMVINIGRLKSGELDYVASDIQAVQQVVAKGAGILKVIIETGVLTAEEKVSASRIVKASGAAFIKTCTGFAGGEATVEDVALMKREVGEGVQVKASGGIRDAAKARSLIAAGATRLGTSSARAILFEDAPAAGY